MFHEGTGEHIEGQPGIMTTIHTAVEAQYTENPSQGDSQIISTDNSRFVIENLLDTKNRRANPDDVNHIYLRMDLKQAGTFNNIIFDDNGNPRK